MNKKDSHIQIKETLLRNEKRLLKKIKSPSEYKWIVGGIFLLFSFKKKFLVFGNNKKSKKRAMASITSDTIMGTKFSYIDDFIVDKKLRGKGIGSMMFKKVLDHIGKRDQSEYAVLVTKDSRKASHRLYKKFGFKMIGLGIGYLAYKKMKNNK